MDPEATSINQQTPVNKFKNNEQDSNPYIVTKR